MELISTAIPDGSTIDLRHAEPAIGGENLSPDLAWTQGPEGTQSYAITCYDPDAPTGSGWWHWVVTDIPADVTSIPLGGPTPEGSRSWANDYGYSEWGGCWPPPGDPAHHYIFTVTAVNTPKLDVPDEATHAYVRLMLHFATLETASFTGLFANPAA
ncbi:MAG TPA: YbhB/YbcL family Raf kinase inhibitor-like protein [Propionibacteriaceae bacterium]|nr:YbhB/YbcL family Raf kinase inhibitor-like protein [Propionibacteriaceae bacterium]HQE31493.1 YbhB/YbcL family Raf kinase inhibitor-like protein [Propionibacteriaceae bacterium]